VFFQAKQWVFCRKANSWAIIAKIGTAILANEINGWYFLIRNTLRWGLRWVWLWYYKDTAPTVLEGNRNYTKPLWRKFAVVGILWAILMPLILFWQEIQDGPSVKLHLLASNLRLASASATNGLVTIPANGMSNWAVVVHDLATTEDRRTNKLAGITAISSTIIIVLSACASRVRREDKNTDA
jgi:hypothetical protein